MASGSVAVMLQIRHLQTCLVSSSKFIFCALTDSISFSLSFRILVNCSLSAKSASTLGQSVLKWGKPCRAWSVYTLIFRLMNRAIRWWWRCWVHITGSRKLWRRFKIIIAIRNKCNFPAWDLSLLFFHILFVVCQCNCSDSFLALPKLCTYMDVSGIKGYKQCFLLDDINDMD